MDPNMMKNAALPKDSLEDVNAMKERSWECGLPPYLQHDLDAYKDGLKNGSTILYGSINAAEIDDGAITPAQADYLRQKYLWR